MKLAIARLIRLRNSVDYQKYVYLYLIIYEIHFGIFYGLIITNKQKTRYVFWRVYLHGKSNPV